MGSMGFLPVQDLVLSEVIEDRGVTELRTDFLQAVDRIQSDPTLRIMVRKHGKLQAVLVSAEAYSAMRDLVDRVVRHADAMTPEERREKALQRLEEDRGSRPAAAVSDRISARDAEVLLSEIGSKLRELEVMLGTSAQSSRVELSAE